MTLGDAQRDGLAQALGRHYAEGRLDASELERRLGELYGGDASAALADLPPLGEPVARRRRGRRHGEADAPESTWIPTTERFVDPTTSRVMRVWVEPAGRRRHYVPESGT